MKKAFLFLTASAFLFSCKKDEVLKDGVFTGPKKTLHHGNYWSSVKITDGKPQQLSILIDTGALKTLSLVHDPNSHHDNTVQLPLPSQAIEYTPFKFLAVDWAPVGHDPSGIYNKPHFDFHFYLSTPSEVATYADNTKMEALPSPEYLPANHVPGPAIPLMGKHWIDITSPEFSGTPFTQTFIYGTYDSKVVFLEPMITLDFLKSVSTFERDIPQPVKFAKSGYYPTKLRIIKVDNTYNIILDGFVKRTAS